MCRWIVFLGAPAGGANSPLLLGDLLSRPAHSLVCQSYHAGYHPGISQRNNAALNADGFGVAFFTAGGRCVLYKSTHPAWSDPNLRELAAAVESAAIFGHVRAASPGSVVSHENTHPFKHGRLAACTSGENPPPPATATSTH